MISGWYELGIGFTRQLSDASYFYVDIDYSFDDDGRDEAINGKVGMRLHW